MVYSVSKSLIITDLDGTLLKTDKSVSEYNLETLRDWTANGGDFTIATGRSVISASHRISELPITRSAVVFNGGILYDYASEQTKLKRELSPEYRKVVADMLKLYPGIGVEIMTDDIIYLPSKNKIVEQHMARESLRHAYCPVEQLPEAGAVKILFGVDAAQIEDFLKVMESKLSECFYSVRTDENYCEIMPDGVDKGYGLQKLKQTDNVSWDCVIAFGDFFNDIPLFEAATVSMATANAPDEVKQKADYVVSSNDDSAICNGIKLLFEQGVLKL